jgi:hemolysin III
VRGAFGSTTQKRDNRGVTDGIRKAADAGRELAEATGERAAAARERVDAAKVAAGERVDAAKVAAGERVDAAKVAAAERVDAAKTAAEELTQRVKPKLRGVIHEYSFPVSLVAGGLLVYFASGGRERLALAIYAISLSALLGTSALYHRVDWKRTSARMWMRRLDHSMIFLLIAGTVTPFLLLVVGGTLGAALLIAVWVGALAGILVEVLWVSSPRWISVAVYLTVGWIGAIAFPSIVSEAGFGAGALIAAGGILYTVGALVYAKQRPDPRPATFGYHEIFHVLVVAAAVAHFAAIAIYAGPTG